MRISFNAPVTLLFSFTATVVMVLSMLTNSVSTMNFFVTYPGQFSLLAPIRMFTHVLGHSDWNHLLSNMTFILLLGPLLEEKYGSQQLFIMIMITAFATALFNSLLFSTGLLGASGIVFMMILLSSFSNFKQGEIPLTFLIVSCMFIGKELIAGFQSDSIAQSAHIIGGITGSAFGYLFKTPRNTKVNM
jgi:rhomboid protease GluP